MNKTLQESRTHVIRGHKTALTLLVLAYTLSITDRMILSILFPDIKTEFGLSDAQLGILGGLSFALFYATLGLPIAKLADNHSRKLIIVTSIIIFSLMTVLSGFAVGFFTLLLFRIGVGIGEAGVNPASHSILADYFSPQKRAFAMAILMAGANLGMLLGFIGGGFLAEAYGWRVTLMVVGFPGLLLAVVMAIRLQEPIRGSFERNEPPIQSLPIQHTAKQMWKNSAMRHLVAGSVVMSIMTYGSTQWLPTFFMRAHDLTQSQIGVMMAGVFGILGALGALLAGKWFDRLSSRGFQYGLSMLALAIILTLPFSISALLADNLSLAIMLFLIPGFTGNFFLGPSFAMIQTLSPVNSRAVASALQMLLINLIGLGLGPLLVGLMSDALTPKYGDNALGLSLACFSIVALWAAVHFLLSARAMAKQTLFKNSTA